MFPVPEFISGIQIGSAPEDYLRSRSHAFFFAALAHPKSDRQRVDGFAAKYSLFAFALAATNGVPVVVQVVLRAVLSFSSNACNGLPALVSVL